MFDFDFKNVLCSTYCTAMNIIYWDDTFYVTLIMQIYLHLLKPENIIELLLAIFFSCFLSPIMSRITTGYRIR